MEEIKHACKRFESGLTYNELAKELGVTRQYIYILVNKGYDEADIRKRCTYKSVHRLCKERGVNYRTVYSRLQRGWAIEDALSLPTGSRYALSKAEK